MSTVKSEPTHTEELPKKLRNLVTEMREVESGATMGASLLRTHNTHLDAARFLEGVATGMQRVTDRLQGELDWDEIPF